MRRIGKAPSRKNPRWCNICFEKAPSGGKTLTIGVLFADVRGSTAFAEQRSAEAVAAVMNRFYARLTQIIVRHGIVDKLIGDEVMGLYFPPLADGGRYVDQMVADSRDIIRTLREDDELTELGIGIGLAVGPAFVGIVGEGAVRDFTAIGDVVNTASRLQAAAGPGQIVMSREVSRLAAVTDGQDVELPLKGKGNSHACASR
ncbi:MAG TPA: adenylate/guanylate cyclase domain-containing protein [Candidatus Acidoferrum sp.]|nr:adenylate/guanylate cyclase domain-containing protein [Candidatus Acidoferrum sp.]